MVCTVAVPFNYHCGLTEEFNFAATELYETRGLREFNFAGKVKKNCGNDFIRDHSRSEWSYNHKALTLREGFIKSFPQFFLLFRQSSIERRALVEF